MAEAGHCLLVAGRGGVEQEAGGAVGIVRRAEAVEVEDADGALGRDRSAVDLMGEERDRLFRIAVRIGKAQPVRIEDRRCTMTPAISDLALAGSRFTP
jgi:hypothetical protein